MVADGSRRSLPRLPDTKERYFVVAARKYWKPVYRKRDSIFNTVVVQRNGEDIWVVGEEEMVESELQWRVQDLINRNILPTWGIFTAEQKTSLINLEIN